MEDAGEHGNALFGKGVGQRPAEPAPT
jgi:hypothetical protein